MTRIYIVFFILLATTLCACSSTPLGVATTTTPSTAPTAAAFDAAATEKTLIELEKKTWNIYQDKKVEEYKKLYTPDFRAIYYGAIKSFDENFADVKDITIKNISFSDWKVTFPVKNTAIMTYKDTASTTYKGQDTSGTYVVTTTWVEINGEWKQAVYAEAKAEPQPKK